MPHLGSFLVCEKFVLDQQQKPTLISLFQAMTAVVPEGQQIPKDTLAGTPWVIFCEWFFDEAELSKSFEQVVEVLLPDGSPSPIRARLPLKEIGKEGQGTRAYINIFGIPIGQTGLLTVTAWLEEDSKRATDVFSYRIKIEHTKEPPSPQGNGRFIPALSQTKPA